MLRTDIAEHMKETHTISTKTDISPQKMLLLFNASKALASTTDLDQLLSVIVGEVQGVLNCEGAGVLLHDQEKDDFYWRTVQDKDQFLSSARDVIRIPKDKGVCGWVFSTGEPALVHDATTDPRIYRPVETKSGFITKNMLCVPLQSRERRLGVLYALNKQDDFSTEDVELMSTLAGNVALALENASYYESLANSHRELERLNRVKTKVLHHLSHELRTPLAIVDASVRIVERRMNQDGFMTQNYPFHRIYRNIERLKTLENQVAAIVQDRESSNDTVKTKLLEYLRDLIDLTSEEKPALSDALDAVKASIEGIFPEADLVDSHKVPLGKIFSHLEDKVRETVVRRKLDVAFIPPDPVILKIGSHIILSVLEGLIRNAIENTPNNGKIVVGGEKSQGEYFITVKDFGVGIPDTEKPNLFEGFYPVREINLYKSATPYDFNAGGTGTDLLKIKVFAERFGFDVQVESTRCSCIPSMSDLCPGDISVCACCQKTEDCYSNGGTTFRLIFPPELLEGNGTLP